MLEQVHVGVASIGSYEASSGAERIAQLRTLAAPLRGVRVLHLNATPYGGGVAEILFSEIPFCGTWGWRRIGGSSGGTPTSSKSPSSSTKASKEPSAI